MANADVQVVPTDGGRTVDLAVRLEPAPSHTIAGELGYGTGEGARVEASWQHRNFFNPEGALTLRGVAGTSEQLAAVQFRRNNFLQRDQILNLSASAWHRKFDAYEARTIQLAGGIERQSNFIWQKKWTWTSGGELLATDERGVFSSAGLKDTRTFFIAALPLSLGYDGSDNLLDPTTGFRLSGRVSPEASTHGGAILLCPDPARRLRLPAGVGPAWSRPGACGWGRSSARACSTSPRRGASTRAAADRSAATAISSLGPRTWTATPSAAAALPNSRSRRASASSSSAAISAWCRFSMAGRSRAARFPTSRTGASRSESGARYYSSFGPIRIDLGVPLNRQPGDGPVAVTVSLGQAF